MRDQQIRFKDLGHWTAEKLKKKLNTLSQAKRLQHFNMTDCTIVGWNTLHALAPLDYCTGLLACNGGEKNLQPHL